MGTTPLSIFQPSSSILIEAFSVQYTRILGFSMSLPTSPVPYHCAIPVSTIYPSSAPFVFFLSLWPQILGHLPNPTSKLSCNQRTSKRADFVHTIGEFAVRRPRPAHDDQTSTAWPARFDGCDKTASCLSACKCAGFVQDLCFSFIEERG